MPVDMDSVRARHVPLDGCRNMRDLGGIGGVQRGVLFRSDDPIKATEDDRLRIRQLRLRTVIDLRTDVEVEKIGQEDCGAKRLLCDIPPNAKVVARTIGQRIQRGYSKGPVGMAESNELIMDVAKDSLARGLRAIAAPGGTPALFHCSSGKDRTGLFAMLLLNFAGVGDDEIAADYALTAELAPHPADALIQAKANFTRFTGADLDDEGARHVLGSVPESAYKTLDMIRRVHGSSENYFRSVLRLTDDEIVGLRKALGVKAPPQRSAPQQETQMPPTSSSVAAVLHQTADQLSTVADTLRKTADMLQRKSKL